MGRVMLCIEHLKRQRGEWVKDSISFVMLDSHDCLHRVAMIYADNCAVKRWVVAWAFTDSPFGILQVSSHTFADAESAMLWVDVAFAEHYEWFDRGVA